MTAPSNSEIRTYSANFIDGEWQPIPADQAVDLVDSFTTVPMARVHLGTAEHVDMAVRAGRRAFDAWAATPIARRAEVVRRAGQFLAERAQEMAAQVTREVGMPLKLSRRVQIDGPVKAWSQWADLGEAYAFEGEVGNSLVRRVPIGVAACITPWNYPLNQITAKVAPALIAGCTVILKPSELAPSCAYYVAEALQHAGCPPGVFNLVQGEGQLVGEALVRDPAVDMVSFTGSTAVGRHIGASAGGNIKRVALELGGKSACVVLEGADIGSAVRNALGSCFLNSGQTCSALTRLIVPKASLQEAIDLLKQGVAGFQMGNPFESATRMGPLISSNQRERVRRMVADAVASGAEIIAGGIDAPVPPSGWFFAPTVLLVPPESAIANEEVFGPVLCVLVHDGEDHAVRLANGTPYGLAAAVWGVDAAHAKRVAMRLRVGQVDVQGAPYNALAPFGGFGQSGLGREHGEHGLEEFLEVQSIQLPV